MPPVIKLEDKTELVDTKQFPYAKYPFEKFNPVQSAVFEVYDKDVNLMLAAATSCGKTVMAELAMAYQLRAKGGKALYLAPMRALAKEKIDDWQKETHHFSDLKLAIATGDYRLTPARKKELAEADIIVMTNEMLSSVCRHYSEEKYEFLKQIGTLVVDECHLLGVKGRGDHAEVGIMKFTEINRDARLVFLSATMPNVKEIAEWASYVLNGKQTYLVDSQYRPCPLGIHWEEYCDQGRYNQVEEYKVEAAMNIVQDYPDDTFLIFAHTKAIGQMMKAALTEAGIKTEFHSADLEKEKRNKIEDAFRNRNPRVIVATSTLAWGCCAYGTKVAMADGSHRNIEDIVAGDKVLSFDAGKSVASRVVKVGDAQVKIAREIVLDSGEVVNVGEDHKCLAAIGRSAPEWVEAQHISIGDYVAVPRRYGIFDADEFCSKSYLLGFVMGDGCLVHAGFHADGHEKLLLDIAFGQDKAGHIPFVKRLLESAAGRKVPGHRADKDGVLHLVCKARAVTEIFRGKMPVGRKGDKIHIPDEIVVNPIKLRSYLMGLFDTDGGVESHSNGNYSIGLSSISESLIRQVQHCLLLFGIRSEVGKKRMEDKVIRGRLQIAKREFSWRIRIYNRYMQDFIACVGFKMKSKQRLAKVAIKSFTKDKYATDILPARELIVEHAELAGVSASKVCQSIKMDKWNAIHKQDPRRDTIQKLLAKHPAKSQLNEMCEADILWKKVKSITKVKGGIYRDIEVEGTHNYVSNGILSHNCNLPARRVIILGVHRGLNTVEYFDIWQEVGRAGRPQYDPRGDAYILLPERKFEELKLLYSTPVNITSRLLDNTNDKYKTLAFHLVHEIHQGDVGTREDIHKWYDRTLAHFQANDLNDEILNSTIESLVKCSAIKLDTTDIDEKYIAGLVGKVSSMFYYSPFDVADLKRNFKYLFEQKAFDDIAISMMLGNTDTQREGYVSRAEADEMSAYEAKVRNIMGNNFTSEAIKGGYAYFTLMRGLNSPVFVSMARMMQFDFPRMVEVLKSLDSMGMKWNKQKWFQDLAIRVDYGVKEELVPLCRLDEVGKARAERLWAAGIKTPERIVENPDHAQKVMGLTKAKMEKVLTAAKLT